MKKIFKHIHAHISKHPHTYIGFAVFCKVMVIGIFVAIGIQTIHNTYAQSICGNSTIERTEYCDDGNTTTGDGCNDVCQLEWFADITDRTQITNNLTTQYNALGRGIEKTKIGSCLAYIKHMENNVMGWMDGNNITNALIHNSAGIFTVDGFPYPRYLQAINNMNLGNTMSAYADINVITNQRSQPFVMDNNEFWNTIYTRHPSMIGGTIGGIIPLGDAVTYDQGLNEICAPYTAVCGNELIEGTGELCDGTNLNGESCVSLGYTAGTLSCTTTCSFDTSSCTNTKSIHYGHSEEYQLCKGDLINCLGLPDMAQQFIETNDLLLSKIGSSEGFPGDIFYNYNRITEVGSEISTLLERIPKRLESNIETDEWKLFLETLEDMIEKMIAINSIVPVGNDQRDLIMGNNSVIIFENIEGGIIKCTQNKGGDGTKCIYVAIGQK